jgi:hypothetical protein
VAFEAGLLASESASEGPLEQGYYNSEERRDRLGTAKCSLSKLGKAEAGIDARQDGPSMNQTKEWVRALSLADVDIGPMTAQFLHAGFRCDPSQRA